MKHSKQVLKFLGEIRIKESQNKIIDDYDIHIHR